MGETVKYRLTRHAVERYVERCQRPLSLKAARVELESMVEVAKYQEREPDWTHGTRRPHNGCLVLGDIALVIQGRYLVTCLTKEPRPMLVRLRRERKRQRKAVKARRRGL